MRIVVLVLLLAACSPSAPEAPVREGQLFAGEGRDRLCTKGERAGFIVYGEGDTNCSVRGRAQREGEQLQAIIPDGDQDCRIIFTEQRAGTLHFGKAAPTCAYYCGPGADFSGKRFTSNGAASPAVDFAGDPLC